MPDKPDELFPDDWELTFEEEGADLPEGMYFSLDDAIQDGWDLEGDNYRGMFPDLQTALAYIEDIGLPYVVAIDDDGWVHVWIAYG